ncbi:MAG: hypothetical protein KJ718_02670 [Nanoarchaeota archaeon]|nr:hypothetical protein [Nanoarchaeota archaeon]MBU1051433.1 hypothetical protein [Nanoarchaeota archaeon]MBU1988070.1 hypothetical protein [Nanoarchaeota archaeon]
MSVEPGETFPRIPVQGTETQTGEGIVTKKYELRGKDIWSIFFIEKKRVGTEALERGYGIHTIPDYIESCISVLHSIGGVTGVFCGGEQYHPEASLIGEQDKVERVRADLSRLLGEELIEVQE